MLKTIKEHINFRYLFILLASYLILHNFHVFFIGITEPGGRVYSSFLADYLNYIAWLRSAVLHGASLLCRLAGFPVTVEEPYDLTSTNATVTIGYTCIGYDLLSFWFAFVIAQRKRVVVKAKWLFAGWMAIWLTNSTRVSVLLFALHKGWAVDNWMEHHDMYNLVAYGIILTMMWFYHKTGSLLQAPDVTATT